VSGGAGHGREAAARVRFHGAAGTVTGSCYEVEHAHGRFLVDCGLFQGSKTLRELNYMPFNFDPHGIDFLLVTHAHIDHSGLVPKLCKGGFDGPIHATEATRDLLAFMLPDSGFIQEQDVRRLNQRNRRRGRPTVTPIYTRDDAEACIAQIVPQPLGRWIDLGGGTRARFWNAGHILGSTSIELEIGDGAAPLRLLFSGDLGPVEKEFHAEPDGPSDVDYAFLEGTYGDRERPEVTLAERREELRREIADALAAGGNLLIPAFAVERTQELLYDIGLLMAEGRLPPVPVFLDSPLAIRATEAFEKHADALHDIERRHGLFRQPNIRFLEEARESQSLDQLTGGAIIIAASGMCDAGRIRHHLRNNLWRREATVLFVGYQAPGTLGSLILDGATAVRIHGEEIKVAARIRRIENYSAHADRQELVAWAKARTPIRHGLFLTHGEPAALAGLRESLAEAGLSRRRIFVPRIDETFELVTTGLPAHRREAPRLAAAAVAPRDWHNSYAALLLDIDHTLQRLPDDAARERLLARLGREVAGAGR